MGTIGGGFALNLTQIGIGRPRHRCAAAAAASSETSGSAMLENVSECKFRIETSLPHACMRCVYVVHAVQ